MQREILFKAKSKETGRWVEGYYCMEHNNACFGGERIEKHYIRFQRNIDWGITQQLLEEIDISTLSQYTGLTDKNGVKIFENDNIKFSYDYFTGDFDTKVGKGIVKFYDGAFYIAPFEIEDKKIEDIENEEWFLIYHVNLEELEIIGNIFDEEVISNGFMD